MKHIVFTTPPDALSSAESSAHLGKTHLIVDDKYTHPDSIYEATWDGKATKLTVVKGNPATLTMRFAGWPVK